MKITAHRRAVAAEDKLSREARTLLEAKKFKPKAARELLHQMIELNDDQAKHLNREDQMLWAQASPAARAAVEGADEQDLRWMLHEAAHSDETIVPASKVDGVLNALPLTKKTR